MHNTTKKCYGKAWCEQGTNSDEVLYPLSECTVHHLYLYLQHNLAWHSYIRKKLTMYFKEKKNQKCWMVSRHIDDYDTVHTGYCPHWIINYYHDHQLIITECSTWSLTDEDGLLMYSKEVISLFHWNQYLAARLFLEIFTLMPFLPEIHNTWIWVFPPWKCSIWSSVLLATMYFWME